MQRKDILELKRRFKKDHCTFTHLCGCYVNGEKQIVSRFREFFPTLDEDELFKYLEIAKKVLSGTIGNNLLKLNFPLDEDFKNESQTSLMQLKKSALKDDALLDTFYQHIIDHYEYPDNFLILVFHDAYDVMTKTTDNQKLDESEEVYEYVLCAICPVSLSDAGLTYYEEEDKIKARIRDWVVRAPNNGFVFPAFIERSADVNSVMYYTRKPKDPHPELMEDVLGCPAKQTAAIQKETFQSIVKDTLEMEEEQAETIFMDIHDNLISMIDEHNAIYEDTNCEPITLTKDHVQDLLIESGIPEETTIKIENYYEESFGDDLPLAQGLIDKKILKASAQMQKEKNLQKHIKVLEGKLEVATQNASVDNHHDLDSEDPADMPDIILQVKPDKVAEIQIQIINGQKCIVIPVYEDEQTRINGADDLI